MALEEDRMCDVLGFLINMTPLHECWGIEVYWVLAGKSFTRLSFLTWPRLRKGITLLTTKPLHLLAYWYLTLRCIFIRIKEISWNISIPIVITTLFTIVQVVEAIQISTDIVIPGWYCCHVFNFLKLSEISPTVF